MSSKQVTARWKPGPGSSLIRARASESHTSATGEIISEDGPHRTIRTETGARVLVHRDWIEED